MEKIKIINVDEYGTVIDPVDWDHWEREWTEEVFKEGQLDHVISHCAPKGRKE